MHRNRLSSNSFLSLSSAAPSPTSSHFPKKIREQPLWFPSAMELLEHVTRNWRSNFVTQDLRTEQVIRMFIKRPFFMLISIDGPIVDRFRRSDEFVLSCKRIRLRNARFHCSFQAGSLDAFVMENDADVYGRRHNLHSQDGLAEQNEDSHPTPLCSLQKYVTLHVINNFDTVATFHSYLDGLNLVDPDRLRPSWDSYFMTLASLASMRSNCMKRRVGAILVRDKRIVATGYNGTPRGLTNCSEGGCGRCNGHIEQESCLCLHAEENALLEAGRERVEGATLYCNTCPCLTCTVKIVQTGVREVVYNLSYKV
ncbi:cytidine deaminase-like protein [Gloeopeniophorella convolvens]|nr:cytidine deaminase-like protein [Gloeopeniophorella convolvens]